jgi:hypothetical protein
MTIAAMRATSATVPQIAHIAQATTPHLKAKSIQSPFGRATGRLEFLMSPQL